MSKISIGKAEFDPEILEIYIFFKHPESGIFLGIVSMSVCLSRCGHLWA
jgi:hypothetical protein